MPHTYQSIKTLIRFAVDLNQTRDSNNKILLDVILSHAETKKEDIDVVSQRIEVGQYELNRAASYLNCECLRKLTEVTKQEPNWLPTLESAMSNPDSLNVMRMLLEKYSKKIIEELNSGKDSLYASSLVSNLYLGGNEKRSAQLKLLNEFGIDPIAIATKLDLKEDNPDWHKLPKLQKSLRDDANERAVNKFFDEHPPKSGSFWFGKDKTNISLEDIVRHAFGENNKGFLSGHSGRATKTALRDDYKVEFNKKFEELPINERVKLVCDKIISAPAKKLAAAAEVQFGSKK
ncbi:MAG: hypothetical protein NTZ67_07790 [Gammaproteobacteria bacterium]|nr:hypothetical protein [Gammaproteobacteria bacterium]